MTYPFSRATRMEGGDIVYPPAGVCIYCGSTKGLSKEHIVPYGLFGDLLLLKGSCDPCREITSRLEAYVLQKMFGGHRKKFNFKSYSKPKNRKAPTSQISRIEPDGSLTVIPIEQDQMPFHSWALPLLGVPGITWLEPLSRVKENDSLKVVMADQDLRTLLAAGGGTRPVRPPPLTYDPVTFMRFLAKIGHSFACATLGCDAFEPLLTDFIRFGRDDPRIFVGGELELEPPMSEAFEVALGTMERSDGTVFLGARIRLLSYMGTPTYTVVVGQGFEDDISAIQDCAYAKPIKITVVGTEGTPIFTSGF